MNIPRAIIVAAALVAVAIIVAPMGLHQFKLYQCVSLIDDGRSSSDFNKKFCFDRIR